MKRKFEEHQEQQRVEDQKKEAERLQKEQEEQERRQVTMVIHPYTGEHMYLTGEQKDQFFRDLSNMKPSDFGPVGTGSMGAGTPSIPGTPPIPSQGFPPRPPMGMGYGALGTPATPAGYGALGTPATPSTPPPPGYVPSFTAPATLPVLPKSTPP